MNATESMQAQLCFNPDWQAYNTVREASRLGPTPTLGRLFGIPSSPAVEGCPEN